MTTRRQPRFTAHKGIKLGPEDTIQAAFFSWVDLHKARFPQLGLIYAVPNAGKRDRRVGQLLKLTGLRAGVPDVCLPMRNAEYQGLYIEFKSEKGRLTDSQKEWIERLESFGHKVAVLRSWTDAANLVIDYLGLSLRKV